MSETDDQLRVEVDWCLARLEEKLAGMDPYSRPAQEAAKVHRILKSSKAPVIKKRQTMRNMFGDYRAKMKAMEKKNLAAMKKSKLVPVKEAPSESKFLRLSTGALQAQNTSNSTVSTAANGFSQLSVEENSETSSGAETHAAVTGAAVGQSSVSVNSSGVSVLDSEFKFNFDGTECGAEADTAENIAPSSHGEAGVNNYFVMKPSGEEFRFNFQADECDQET